MAIPYDRDLTQGLEFVVGGTPKLASRQQLEQIIKERRAAGYGAAYRSDEGDENCCLGCLMSMAGGIYEMVTDFNGERAKARDKAVFEGELKTLAEGLEETIPVIEIGLDKMRGIVEDFVDSLPAESDAKKVVEKYDAACFCEPFDLGDGVKAVLLRGEFKLHDGFLYHRGDSGKEERFRQRGCVVTSEGDFYEVELLGMSVRRDRDPRQASAMEVRDFLSESLSRATRKTFLEGLNTSLKEAKRRGGICRFTPKDQLYMGKEYRVAVEKFDLETSTEDQKRLREFLLASQERALIVGLSVGKKELENRRTQTKQALFPRE